MKKIKIIQTIKLLLFFIISNLFFSCITSKVEQDEYLLVKNEFKFKGKSMFKNELDSYVKQKPNKKMFAILPFGLWLYNLSDNKLDSSFEEYDLIIPSERSKKKLDSIFNKNKVDYNPKKNYWFQRQANKFGDKPVIADPQLANQSANRLKIFFEKKGFYDTNITYEVKPTSKKKVKVIYIIDLKNQTKIKEYKVNITDNNIKNIYEKFKKTSFIKEKHSLNQFNLEKEITRLENIYKNYGYFDINKNRDIYFEADTLKNNKLANLELVIQKDTIEKKYEFTKYKMNKITIHNYKENITEKNKNKIQEYEYQGYNIKFNRKKYNLSTFTNLVILEPNKYYSLKDEISTKRRIDIANAFDLSYFKYSVEKDSLLNLDIFMSPKLKYDLDFSNDLQYSSLLNLGFSPGINFKVRNIFKGAENLDIKLQGTFGTINYEDSNQKNFLNAYDITAQAKITYPRILFPYANYIVPKKYLPTSEFFLGLSTQKNIGLGQIKASSGLNYIIRPTETTKHRVNLFNGQLVNVTQADNYFLIFTNDSQIRNNMHQEYFIYNPSAELSYNNGEITQNDLDNIINSDSTFKNEINQTNPRLFSSYSNMIQRKIINTNSTFNNSFIYEFEYNERLDKLKLNPLYFNLKTEYSGFLPQIIDNIFDLNGKILGLEYTKFIKFDLDFRKTWNLNTSNQLAFRQFLGMAFSLDNKEIPFYNSYFMGGSNDLRAWVPFALGPANINYGRLSYGTMKILSSIEYRFPILGSLNGGLFVDSGNIWSTKKDDNIISEEQKTQFKFNNFYNQLALGSGFGFRYDLKYLILRFDFAYKIIDPTFIDQKKNNNYFKQEFLKPTINFAINYPF